MNITFRRYTPGQYQSIDSKFLILGSGTKWNTFLRDGNIYEFYAGGFKSLRAAKEHILNSWYHQHVNL